MTVHKNAIAAEHYLESNPMSLPQRIIILIAATTSFFVILFMAAWTGRTLISRKKLVEFVGFEEYKESDNPNRKEKETIKSFKGEIEEQGGDGGVFAHLTHCQQMITHCGDGTWKTNTYIY